MTTRAMNIVQTDFAAMSMAERVRHFEVEGYVLLPALIDKHQVARLSAELADLPMNAADYSAAQTSAATPPQWHSRAVAELIGHPPMIAFLRELMGDDIVFTRAHFARSHPGHPGISLHTDGQPYGSSIFDWEGSSPVMVRALYYLHDLTPERSPFRIVPRSHISFHADANPYLRYESHPGEVTICAKAGDGLVFAVRAFHGTHPNVSDGPREMVQYGYRPGWAGPVQPIPEWDPELVASAPQSARPFLQSRNKADWKWELENKPKDMKTYARGIDPQRWA